MFKKSTETAASALLTPDFLKPTGLPARLETIDGVVRPIDEHAPAPQTVETAVYLDGLAKDWAANIGNPAKRPAAIIALAGILRVTRISMTGDRFIPRESSPINHAQIVSTADAVFKTLPFISEDARYVVRGLPVEEAQQVRAVLADCYEARATTTAFDGDLDAMIACGENFLDRFLRLFDQRAAALMESDREVASRLAPLDQLIRGGAQKADRTRALTERVATQAEADTLARVAAAQAAAAAAAATPPIVAPPVVINTALPAPVAPKGGGRRK